MLTIPATSKTLEGRLDLQSRFQDKKTLSASHFHMLIDSTVNKVDDRFYGVWTPRSYLKGAVVYDEVTGFLWQAIHDVCSTEGKSPSKDPENWKSTTYDLQQDVIALQAELTQLRQFVILLGMGLAAIIFWWLVVAIYHFLVGLF